jgi:hypothetical protein
MQSGLQGYKQTAREFAAVMKGINSLGLRQKG